MAAPSGQAAEAASLLADAREAVLTAGLAPTENLHSLAGLVSADDFSGVLSELMRERERVAVSPRVLPSSTLRSRSRRLRSFTSSLILLCSLPRALETCDPPPLPGR